MSEVKFLRETQTPYLFASNAHTTTEPESALIVTRPITFASRRVIFSLVSRSDGAYEATLFVAHYIVLILAIISSIGQCSLDFVSVNMC